MMDFIKVLSYEDKIETGGSFLNAPDLSLLAGFR
jgi:hypothetical protein